MPKVYAIDGIAPVVHPSAFVHPSAVLHGCVVPRGALVGMNCVVNVRSARTMELVEALTEPEENRKSIAIPGAIPLSELKKKHA